MPPLLPEQIGPLQGGESLRHAADLHQVVVGRVVERVGRDDHVGRHILVRDVEVQRRTGRRGQAGVVPVRALEAGDVRRAVPLVARNQIVAGSDAETLGRSEVTMQRILPALGLEPGHAEIEGAEQIGFGAEVVLHGIHSDRGLEILLALFHRRLAGRRDGRRFHRRRERRCLHRRRRRRRQRLGVTGRRRRHRWLGVTGRRRLLRVRGRDRAEQRQGDHRRHADAGELPGSIVFASGHGFRMRRGGLSPACWGRPFGSCCKAIRHTHAAPGSSGCSPRR